MKSIMTNIHQAAADGKSSMDKTIYETSNMSGKIDAVKVTIQGNVQLLDSTVKDIKVLNESMSGISVSADEINKAMEISTADAEKLTHMTDEIHKSAIESSNQATKVSKIDSELSDIVKNMLSNLKNSSNSINNKDFMNYMEKAKKSHKEWLVNLKRAVDEMKVYPLQLDGSKCAFGHFYYAINVEHPKLVSNWKSIEKFHLNFHNCGKKVMDAIQSKNYESAHDFYKQAEEISVAIFNYLEDIINEVKSIDASGDQIFNMQSEEISCGDCGSCSAC